MIWTAVDSGRNRKKEVSERTKDNAEQRETERRKTDPATRVAGEVRTENKGRGGIRMCLYERVLVCDG